MLTDTRVALGAAAECGSWEVGPPETTNPMVLEKLLLPTPILLSRRGGQLHLPQFSWPMSLLLESSQPVLGLPHSAQPYPAQVLWGPRVRTQWQEGPRPSDGWVAWGSLPPLLFLLLCPGEITFDL